MRQNESRNLKEMILEEMKVDYDNVLDKNFNLARKFFKITGSGTIDVIDKEHLSTRNKILMYLIGKKYAWEAELTDYEGAGNSELKDELGIPEGTLLPGIKDLRDKRMIKTVKRDGLSYHNILQNLIEKVLNDFDRGYH